MPTATQLASAQPERTALRPEIVRIIESGQTAVMPAQSLKAVLAVTTLTCAMLWISFAPLEFAPAAWVALVPLCQMLRVPVIPRRSYLLVTLVGFAWALGTLQWMRLGHWTMYGALVALSFYMSLYFPAFLMIGRAMLRGGIPLWLTVPLAWTALEYLKAWLMTGFSWYYLGHSQFQWTALIQISDATGAYGVSFVVALASGALAECVPANWLRRLRLIETDTTPVTASSRSVRIGLSASVLAVVLSCVYGYVRHLPAEIAADDKGPVVAVIQGNFTPEIKHDPDQWSRMAHEHDLLSRRAAGLRPDLIVWPETMFPVPIQIVGEGVTDKDLISFLPLESSRSNSEAAAQLLERWHSNYAQIRIANRSQESGAAMLVGLVTEVARKDRWERFNSAAFVRPDLGYVGRYDKMHRVIFGEYIPFRSVFPWLAKLTPFSAGFGMDAGTAPAVFEYAGTRFTPIICFEDTVPHLVRHAVNATDADGEHPDVLINMTNDGWFRGSSELDQHLITSVFRCVETRRPMVRSVNAGISAFIDSSGRIRQPEHFLIMNPESPGILADFQPVTSMIDPATGRRHRQCSAVMCGQIPLDGRQSLYLRFGDWFAGLCSIVTVIAVVRGRKQPLPFGRAAEIMN